MTQREPEPYELQFLANFLHDAFGMDRQNADIAVIYCYPQANEIYDHFLNLQMQALKLNKLVKHITEGKMKK